MDNIKLLIPNKPEFVSIARLTASVLANAGGFNVEDIEDIKVAIGEACNNSVLHGKKSLNLDLSFTVNDNKFIAEIIDNGDGFDFDEYTNPDLEACNGKGLGIFIMESLMDLVEIKSTLGSGTKIILTKELT